MGRRGILCQPYCVIRDWMTLPVEKQEASFVKNNFEKMKNVVDKTMFDEYTVIVVSKTYKYRGVAQFG